MHLVLVYGGVGNVAMKSQSNRHWYISNSPLGPDLRLFDQCLTDLAIISQLHNSPPHLSPSPSLTLSLISPFLSLSWSLYLENEPHSLAVLHLEEFSKITFLTFAISIIH